MDATQLRHHIEKAELRATELRRLAENLEHQVSDFQEDNPSKAQMMAAEALRHRAEAEDQEKQARAFHDEMEQKKSKAEQLRNERLRVKAEYEAKMQQLDTEITNLEGVLF